jgi:hypothetical protein
MSGSDYSDVTDIDNEYSAPSRRRRKSGANDGQKNTYKIRNALKVPRATTYTAQALYGEGHKY